MSTLNDIVERVATIQSTIVVGEVQTSSAYPYQPSDISSAELPFWINEINGGPVHPLATQGALYIDDTINMYLCIARSEEGADLKYNVQNTASFRDAVFQTFAAKIRLGGDLTYIIDAFIQDWDMVEYEYGTTKFLALLFRLRVREAMIVTYAP